MLDLEPTDEHLAVAELARSLGLELLSPAAREAETERAVPSGVWHTLFESGLTVPVPEEFGGGGIPDTVTQMIAVENLAYGDAGITLAAMWSGSAALLLARHGTKEQTALLPELAGNPDSRGAVALYEGHGRAPAEFTTSVTRTADGRLRVNGRKVAVAFADRADPLIVVGVEAESGRLRAVLVPTSDPGVVVTAGNRGLALDAAPTATVTFDVTVPAQNLVGDAEDDAVALGNTVGRIRLAVAAAQVGTAQRAVEYASKYATERVAFGRPIAGFQGVSFPLAEAQIRIEAVRLEIAEAATLLDGDDYGDHADAVTRVVNYAGEVAAEATRTAVQTLGGHGFIVEHPVELWYRSAAALSALDFDPLCSSFEPAL
ncbi:acyl-CoA dehydrogenase family protein [Streptomyces sp. GbtcB7]|uniref:acyl-CoA dehydrogenase family protein n=1 Tax=Streptomyces sp. GbtcB7 TaxID=2824752 RepID=UPI001C2FEFB4|nr:acyl-CoA dehydrogenase family protein [Streptomyces sp. GbtcB7]